MRNKSSIRSKFTAIIYLLGLAALGIAFLLSLFLNYDFHRSEQNTSNQNLAASIASILSAPLSISDYSEVQRILGFYTNDLNGTIAAVVVGDDILLGDYDKYQFIKDAWDDRRNKHLDCETTSRFTHFDVFCHHSKQSNTSVLLVNKHSTPMPWTRIWLLLVLFSSLFSVLIFSSKKIIQKILIKPLEDITEKLTLLNINSSPNLVASLASKDNDAIEFSKLTNSFSDLIQRLLNEQNRVVELSKNKAAYSIARQVAHDIRSPVSALLTAASTVTTKPEEATLLIKLAAERIDRIASDLLSSPTTTKIKNSNDQIDQTQNIQTNTIINDIIKEIVIEKRAEFASHSNIIISDVIEENKRAALCSQSLDIKRIISNLINNSVESTVNTNCIQITASTSTDLTKISISDQGAGIPDNILHTLNSETITAPITTKKNGHGLGISAAKEALGRAGGSLVIRSKVGSGSIVDIYVPTSLSLSC